MRGGGTYVVCWKQVAMDGIRWVWMAPVRGYVRCMLETGGVADSGGYGWIRVGTDGCTSGSGYVRCVFETGRHRVQWARWMDCGATDGFRWVRMDSGCWGTYVVHV